MLERLVLKNAVDCTSQRLKRTSGVRVMIFLCLPLIGSRQADKQTSRHVDKQTCRQADKQTSRYELVVVGCWLLVVVGRCWLMLLMIRMTTSVLVMMIMFKMQQWRICP